MITLHAQLGSSVTFSLEAFLCLTHTCMLNSAGDGSQPAQTYSAFFVLEILQIEARVTWLLGTGFFFHNKLIFI